MLHFSTKNFIASFMFKIDKASNIMNLDVSEEKKLKYLQFPMSENNHEKDLNVMRHNVISHVLAAFALSGRDSQSELLRRLMCEPLWLCHVGIILIIEASPFFPTVNIKVHYF